MSTELGTTLGTTLGNTLGTTLLHHGGKLRVAAQRYNMLLSDWLDLSTGINPNGWPVPAIPANIWQRLPEEDDGLEEAARDYYGAPQLLPVAGSQAAIQALPQLRSSSRVTVLNPAYAEHAHAWQRAGHQVTTVAADEIDSAIAHSDVVLLINPNNPSGARFGREQLLQWHHDLSKRSGWLIVDEAFMDCTAPESLCAETDQPGLIVLRSLGKFFGLAGARVGFVCAETTLLQQLNTLLGPWTINAAARYIASAALNDRDWQMNTRQQLQQAGERLRHLLTEHDLTPSGGCALFQWIKTDQAESIHTALARQGILTRLFTTPSSLRFGLPADESQWQRLATALQQLEPTP